MEVDEMKWNGGHDDDLMTNDESELTNLFLLHNTL